MSEFPVDSYRDAAPLLRRPFTPAAVKFKVQATWPKNAPTGGLIVSYIDARLAVERLNLIVPHLWHDEYEPRERHLLCRLTVDGITRQDVGEGVVKGLYSDAFKRAAVKFGVGVSLYAIPQMMLNASDGHLKAKQSNQGPTLVLTPAGENLVRSRYETWLREHGVHAFGEPLDHGDSPDAQGDAEIEQPVVVDEKPAVPRIEPDVVEACEAAMRGLGWKVGEVRTQLAAHGAQDVSDVKAALRSLSREQGDRLWSEIQNAVAA